MAALEVEVLDADAGGLHTRSPFKASSEISSWTDGEPTRPPPAARRAAL
jgi:hypothetical protein